MPLESTRYADVVVLAPSGRIDHASAEVFRSGLTPFLDACRDGGDALLLDLSGLEYISSAGLRVLMLASRQTRPRGGRVAIAAMTELVAEIFRISRFDQVFAVHASVDAALAALSPAAVAARAGAQPAGPTGGAR